MAANKRNRKMVTALIALSMTILMVFPTVVFAEGEEPPIPDDTGTPVESTGSVETTEPVPDETTETPPEESTAPAAEETTEPIPDAGSTGDLPQGEEIPEDVPTENAEEESVEDPETTGDQPPAPISTETIDLGEVVAELGEANIIIVDESGEVLPLASVEAEAVLAAPDPVGCPPGTLPTWLGGDGIGCTTNYTTIQAAIDDAAVIDGWTVYVQAGTYTENVKLYKSINLVGEDAATTIIAPAAGPGIYVRADTTSIINFTIDTLWWGIDFDGGSGYLPGEVTGGIDATVIDNVNITGNTMEGIFIGNGADVTNLEIKDSKLLNNLNGIGVSGATTSLDELTITNSTINANTNHGLIIQGNAQVGDVTIEDSLMSSNTLQGVMVQTGAVVESLEITNSEITDNKGVGLSVNAATVNDLRLIDTYVGRNNQHGMYLFNATISILHSMGSSYDWTHQWEGINIQGSTIGTMNLYQGNISNNNGQGLSTRDSTFGTIDIWGNIVQGNDNSGLALAGTVTNTLWIDENSFVNNAWEDVDLGWWGGPLKVIGETRIYGGNVFIGGAWNSIWVDSASSFSQVPVINYNFIDGPAWALVNLGDKVINAEYNYWGCDGGIGSPGCSNVVGAGWAISPNIDTDPWLTDPDTDQIFSSSDGTQGWGWDIYLPPYDNCPETFNPDQLDSDGDGIGDVCDPTPFPPGSDSGRSAGASLSDLPAGLIPVTGGELVTLSCTITNSLQLPSGDMVVFNTILCDHQASLAAELTETLPQALPDGSTFASGMTVVVLRDGTALETLGAGAMTVSFSIPAGMESAAFGILYWDAKANEWVEITPVTITDGMVSATVGDPGTYILVTK